MVITRVVVESPGEADRPGAGLGYLQRVDSVRMGPVNAAVRFVAELVALYGIGAGTWARTDSIVAAVALPVAAATVWGVFRVPDDPGAPPVAVPGPVRLVIEAALFGGGALGLWVAHGAPAALAFALVVVVHYATTPRRVRYVWSCRRWGAVGRGAARSR